MTQTEEIAAENLVKREPAVAELLYVRIPYHQVNGITFMAFARRDR